MLSKIGILNLQGCKAENNRFGCINRDENATNNMIKIVKSYLKDKIRPLKYTRGYEIK